MPEADVTPGVPRSSDTRATGPFKGEARYSSLEVDGRRVEDPAWSRPEPVGDGQGVLDPERADLPHEAAGGAVADVVRPVHADPYSAASRRRRRRASGSAGRPGRSGRGHALADRPPRRRRAARASGSAIGRVASCASAATVHQEQTLRCLVTCSASR
ncbi:DUF427 domain-containing protein [Geodermatophilus sp. DF01-2]|nr:DUF427 domain-containing protein [Geodermatophilus sp. DF01_2]